MKPESLNLFMPTFPPDSSQMRSSALSFAPSVLSLAYIGTASNTGQRDELEHHSRRFRLGDKKEAAGAAVAVISRGCMDIECCFVVW